MPTNGEWKTECGPSRQWNGTQPQKGMKFWCALPHGMNPEPTKPSDRGQTKGRMPADSTSMRSLEQATPWRQSPQATAGAGPVGMGATRECSGVGQ